MAKGDSLTAKQLAFIREYAVDRNATQAAIRAGYSASSANSKAGHLLADPRIKSALAAEVQRQAERVDVTVDEIVQALRGQLYLDRTQVIGLTPEEIKQLPEDVRFCIESVEFEAVPVKKTDEEGNEETSFRQVVKKLKFTNRQATIDALMRYKGMNREKREFGVDVDSLRNALKSIPDKQLSTLAEACGRVGVAIN